MKKIINWILIILSLEIILSISKFNQNIIPLPSAILKTFLNQGNTLLYNLIISLIISLISLLFAIIISLYFSYLIEENKKYSNYLLKSIYISQLIPTITIAPIFIIWFGFNYITTIIIVTLMAIFPIVINILNGYKSIDKEYLLLSKTYNLDSYNLYKKIKIPLILPNFFTGLKIALTYSLSTTIIVEFIGTPNGLGTLLNRALTNFNTSLVFSITILVVLTTLLQLKIINKIQSKLIKYI